MRPTVSGAGCRTELSRLRPQLSLKETITAQRALEVQLASSRSADSTWEFKTKELEGRLRALEKENEMLRQKVTKFQSPAAR